MAFWCKTGKAGPSMNSHPLGALHRELKDRRPEWAASNWGADIGLCVLHFYAGPRTMDPLKGEHKEETGTLGSLHPESWLGESRAEGLLTFLPTSYQSLSIQYLVNLASLQSREQSQRLPGSGEGDGKEYQFLPCGYWPFVCVRYRAVYSKLLPIYWFDCLWALLLGFLRSLWIRTYHTYSWLGFPSYAAGISSLRQ